MANIKNGKICQENNEREQKFFNLAFNLNPARVLSSITNF